MRDDQLVAEYLRRLRRAAWTMPRARRRGAEPVRQFAFPGDGPSRIWNVASVRFPRSYPGRPGRA